MKSISNANMELLKRALPEVLNNTPVKGSDRLANKVRLLRILTRKLNRQ